MKNIKKTFMFLVIMISAVQAGPDMLTALTSPVLFRGDSVTAYRDPAVLYHGNTFYLFFTLVQVEPDGKVFSYTAESRSTDLQNWTEPVIITARDQQLNFCSPGNIVRFGEEWMLCLQTYPRPGYHIADQPVYGNADARVYTMKSRDLVNWDAPRLMRVKGDVPFEKMGRMIDPYLVGDKDDAGKWWCFYKQNGVSMSWSRDLSTGTFSAIRIQVKMPVCWWKTTSMCCSIRLQTASASSARLI